VHGAEDGHKLVFCEDTGYGSVIHLCLVRVVFPFQVLNDPKAAIVLLLVQRLDELLTKGVVEILRRLVSHGVGPVLHLLVDGLALGQLHVQLVKVCIGLARGLMDRLRALHLDAHGSSGNRRLAQIKLIKPIVDVLSHREVAHLAGTSLAVTIGVQLGVMVWVDFAGRMEVVVVCDGNIRIGNVSNQRLQGALLNPG